MAFIADASTYDLVKSMGFHCTFIDDNNASNIQKRFGDPEFTKFSFVRYKFIHESLKTYKHVWYLDVDTVVLDDLNIIAQEYIGRDHDIVFQNDIHQIKYCTGCMLISSNKNTMDMTAYLYNIRLESPIPDQHVVNLQLKHNPCLKTSMFDVERFQNGLLFFDLPELIDVPIGYAHFKKKFHTTKKLAFVHANWMIGIDKKINALKKKGLWFASF